MVYSLNKNINDMIYKDLLTGLYNRYGINNKIAHLTGDCSLLMFNISDFKYINNNYSHIIGDRFLIAISKRMKSICPKNSFIARIVGDEFAILIETINKSEAEMFAKAIIEAMNQPFYIDNYELIVSINAGVTLVTAQSKKSEEFLKEADLALHYSKKVGKNSFLFYHRDLKIDFEENTKISNILRIAIKEKDINLKFQPIVDCNNNSVIGFECLARLQDFSPLKFIKIAEETGLIYDLTLLVITKACQTIENICQMYQSVKTITVNISSQVLLNKNFFGDVERIINKYSFDKKILTFEITESVFISDKAAVSQIMKSFNQKEIRFALDDFGTGYSSLNCLTDFDISFVKIDKCFVDSIKENKVHIVVKKIVELCKELNLEIIVEGVEKNFQLELLKQMKVNLIQGFLYYKPLNYEELLEKI